MRPGTCCERAWPPPPLGRRLRAAHPRRGPDRPRCARWISVDDTGARHRHRNAVCTQLGNDHFATFATTGSKSRLNFLEVLRAGYRDYVVNAEALAYMRQRDLAGPVIALLATHPVQRFPDEAAWMSHLEWLGITALAVTPDPARIATEGAASAVS
jgi:hypothetical protein